MVNLLVANKLPVLLTAGIPDGTRIAHKHGWVTYNGVINAIGDAGIIYIPGRELCSGGVPTPSRPACLGSSFSIGFGIIAAAVYNYFNLPDN